MAALSYHYARSIAWLEDLAPERDPHAYDLCEHHVVRLRVPAGWSLDDRRLRVEHVVPTRLAG